MPSKLYSSFNDSLRARQNKRLKADNPNWRKEAGGGRGLYRKLRKARELADKDPRIATRLNMLTQKAHAFQQNRSELLGELNGRSKSKKGGPAGPRPVHPIYRPPKPHRSAGGQRVGSNKRRFYSN